jgi:DNA polymerase III sliding clamp (beta) subunit (PCNA family)
MSSRKDFVENFLSEILIETEKVTVNLRANELDVDFKSRRKSMFRTMHFRETMRFGLLISKHLDIIQIKNHILHFLSINEPYTVTSAAGG